MDATVVITTKNRCEDLRKAVASALAQTVQPEVLVIDDGSMDGTSQLIAREFPSVRLHRSEKSLGLIVQRNRAAQLTANPIIFSIDDDAVFSTPRVVEQTLHEFNHARVGAVAIPFIDINRGPEVKQRAPEADQIYAAYSFIGTAHAIRRDLFLALGGYREILVHQGEEEDFCTRMLGSGYVTRAGLADPIHHFESPRRSWTRMDYYGARNKVLYVWQNVPFPFAPGHLGVTTGKTLLHSLLPNRLWARFRGVMAAYALCSTGQCDRKPVAASIYRLGREVKRRVTVPLREIEPLL
ncbi:MAG: glycosyltransferase family 2 protein [Opitutaceae bacterium]|nr:glycosyltransferase family 2 protein [Verrucomicrobiales bacterium]